jgi:hypothetical protein
MSSQNSMNRWTELALERRWLALFGQIAKLTVLQHDLLTARFAYRALRLAIKGQTSAERLNTSLIT